MLGKKVCILMKKRKRKLIVAVLNFNYVLRIVATTQIEISRNIFAIWNND